MQLPMQQKGTLLLVLCHSTARADCSAFLCLPAAYNQQMHRMPAWCQLPAAAWSETGMMLMAAAVAAADPQILLGVPDVQFPHYMLLLLLLLCRFVSFGAGLILCTLTTGSC
jgi:hypothetical protein